MYAIFNSIYNKNEELSFLYNKSTLIIDNISEFASWFSDILLLILYIIAIIGGYFWFSHKKRSIKYKLEKSQNLDLFPQLINDSIETNLYIENISRNIIPSLIILSPIPFVFGLLAYFVFGLDAFLKTIVLFMFLNLIWFLHWQIKLMAIQINDGIKNNSHISTFIIINSISKIVSKSDIYLHNIFSKNNLGKIANHDKFNGLIKYVILLLKWLIKLMILSIRLGILLIKSIKYLLFYLILPLMLLIYNIILFGVYAFLLILGHYLKYISIRKDFELMTKLPMCVIVEYLSGEKESNLILYQSTSLDYRFKHMNSSDEYIIPASSIKSIKEDYAFALSQLDIMTNDDAEYFYNHLKNNQIYGILKYITNYIRLSILYKIWLQKSLIYSKKNDHVNAKISLIKALESPKTPIELILFSFEVPNEELSIKYRNNEKIKQRNLALIHNVKNNIEFKNINNEMWFDDLSKKITESKPFLEIAD